MIDYIMPERVPVANLHIKDNVQRALDTKWAEEIAANFDPRKLNPLRGIKYLNRGTGSSRVIIIDGQHRLAALRIMGAEYAPVMIVTLASDKEAAEFFIDLNEGQKRVQTRSKVQITAQNDGDSLEAFALSTFKQYNISDTSSIHPFKAYKAMMEAAEAVDPDSFDSFVYALSGIPEYERIYEWVVRGITILFVKNESICADRLHNTFAEAYFRIRNELEDSRVTGHRKNEVASRVIAEFYNKGLRNSKRIVGAEK